MRISDLSSDVCSSDLLDYILQNKPAQAPVNVLWGDATPSNVMFDDEGKVKALIDWELATLGPAELDLAWWLYFDDLFSRRFGVQRLEGLPTREESIAIWEAAVGRKAENLDYYDIVVGLRMALVVVGAFDRQVSVGNVTADNKSLNANLMTMYLAEKMGMPLPELGPDFYRSEEHTSELQSLMRISYAVFCLKK